MTKLYIYYIYTKNFQSQVFLIHLEKKLTFAFELSSKTYHLNIISKVRYNVYKTSIPFGLGWEEKSSSLQVSLVSSSTFIKYSQFHLPLHSASSFPVPHSFVLK